VTAGRCALVATLPCAGGNVNCAIAASGWQHQTEQSDVTVQSQMQIRRRLDSRARRERTDSRRVTCRTLAADMTRGGGDGGIGNRAEGQAYEDFSVRRVLLDE
jgi:hypothetical protein